MRCSICGGNNGTGPAILSRYTLSISSSNTGSATRPPVSLGPRERLSSKPNLTATVMPSTPYVEPTKSASLNSLVVPVFPITAIGNPRELQDQPRDPASRPSWLPFLKNHREAIAAMDLFTVPTVLEGAVIDTV